MSAIKEVNDNHFDAEVLQSPLPVLVDFSATWCGPCMLLGPIIDELAIQWNGKIKVCKVDVDDSYKTARRYGILTIPTLMLFKNGKSIDRIMGVSTKTDIERRVKNALTD